MTTINLHQNQQEMQEKLSARSANGGFFFSLAILIVTLLAFAGFRVAVSTIGNQNAVLAETIQKETEKISGFEDLQRIIDQQKRLQQIKSNLQIKGDTVSRIQMTQALANLGSDVDTGIVVSSYKFENPNVVSLTFNANNFNDVSKQIMSFKNSAYFTDVTIVKISRGEKSVVCDVKMTIKG